MSIFTQEELYTPGSHLNPCSLQVNVGVSYPGLRKKTSTNGNRKKTFTNGNWKKTFTNGNRKKTSTNGNRKKTFTNGNFNHGYICIHQIYRSPERVKNLVVKVDGLPRDSLDPWDGMSDDLWVSGCTVSFSLNSAFLFNGSQMNDFVIQHKVTGDAIQS